MKKFDVAIVVVFLITFLVSGLFAVIGVDSHHDGAVFKPAMDVLSGKVLFKETSTQYGPLTTYIQALVLWLFGKYLLSIRIFTAFIYALIGVFLLQIHRKILPPWLALLGCGIWLGIAPFYVWTFLAWSNVYCLFFKLGSLLFFLNYLNNNQKRYLIYAGLATALTILTKHNDGIYIFLAYLFSIGMIGFYHRRNVLKDYFSYALGILLLLVPFFAYLMVMGAITDWYIQLILFSFSWFASNTGSMWNIVGFLLPFNESYLWTFMPIVCVLAFVQYTWLIFRRRNLSAQDLSLYIIVVVSLASWLNYIPVPCIRHLFWGSTSMVGVILFYIWNAGPTRKNNLSNIIMVLCFVVFIFGSDFEWRITEGWKKLCQSTYKCSNINVLYGMRLTKAESQVYSDINALLMSYSSKHPQAKLINLSPDPMIITFYDNSENAHKLTLAYNMLIKYYADYYHTINKYISNNRPIIITYDKDFLPPGYYRLSAYTWFKFNCYGDHCYILAPKESL